MELREKEIAPARIGSADFEGRPFLLEILVYHIGFNQMLKAIRYDNYVHKKGIRSGWLTSVKHLIQNSFEGC